MKILGYEGSHKINVGTLKQKNLQGKALTTANPAVNVVRSDITNLLTRNLSVRSIGTKTYHEDVMWKPLKALRGGACWMDHHHSTTQHPHHKQSNPLFSTDNSALWDWGAIVWMGIRKLRFEPGRRRVDWCWSNRLLPFQDFWKGIQPSTFGNFVSHPWETEEIRSAEFGWNWKYQRQKGILMLYLKWVVMKSFTAGVWRRTLSWTLASKYAEEKYLEIPVVVEEMRNLNEKLSPSQAKRIFFTCRHEKLWAFLIYVALIPGYASSYCVFYGNQNRFWSERGRASRRSSPHSGSSQVLQAPKSWCTPRQAL